MDTLTKSRLYSWRKCQRLHKLRYLDGWRAITDTEPQRFGTLVHSGLEAWWRGDLSPIPIGPDVDAVMAIKAQEILRGYVQHAWPDRHDYDVLAVEHPVRFPLINPDTMQPSKTYEMGGVLDLVLYRRKTGETILVEHKTTGADFSDDAADYWRRLAMDSQLSIYVVGAEAAGFEVSRIIYDVLARPMLRLKLATPKSERRIMKRGLLDARQRDRDESHDEFRTRLRADIESRPERYFGRREIARLESELRESMLDVWQDAKAMRAAEVAGRHPRNPDACHMMGGTCEFFDVCSLGINPAESSMYRQSDDRHPEITRGFAALEVSK